MPNIPEFNLPSAQAKLDPRSEGASATMRSGRIIQETAKSEGDAIAQGWRAAGHVVATAGHLVDDVMTQRDIASAAEAHTRLTAQAATDLPKLLANSTDPVQAVKDYYDKTYGPGVEKINSDMMTKRSRMWAAEHSQSGAQAFMRSGISEAMSVQGARAIQSFQNSVNNLGQAARSDPHNLDDYLKQADSLLDGTKGTLNAAQQVQMEMHRNKVKQDITINAAHALAEQNPAQFAKDLAAGWGKDVLDPHHREMLTHYATYAQKRQGRIAKGTSTGVVADWMSGKLDDNGHDREITPEDIGRITNNPSVQPEDKTAVQKFGVTMNRIQTWMQEHKIKGRGVPPGNAGVELDLRSRLADQNNPTTLDQITDALQQYEKNPHTGISPSKALDIAKKIKPGKAMDINHLHNDPILKTEMGRAKTIIQGNKDPNSTSTNPAVKGKQDDFELDVLRQLQGALDRGENYKEYLDPKSPKYLFAPERIEQFKPSKQELQNQIVNRPPTVHVKPEDSQFLKATPPRAAPGKPGAPKAPIGDFFKGLMGGSK